MGVRGSHFQLAVPSLHSVLTKVATAINLDMNHASSTTKNGENITRFFR